MIHGVPVGVKSCSSPNCQCDNPQPLSQFNKDRATKDGFAAYCRTCRRQKYLEKRRSTRPLRMTRPEPIYKDGHALIPLSGAKGAGLFAKVSLEDVELVRQYRWYLHNTGYVVSHSWIKHNSSRYRMMHRLILGVGDDELVDHADHDKLNNTRGNIRICTQSQNRANELPRGGKSPYKGVYWQTKLSKWVVRLKVQGKVTYLGYYSDPAEAARVYDACMRYLFGKFAHTNFPGDEALSPEEIRRRAGIG